MTCKFPAGAMQPRIDPSSCEGKGPCVPICPYGVLAIHAVSPAEKALLSWGTRLKLLAHGGRQAFVQDPDACHGCGLCVQVCPEHAITLQRRVAPAHPTH